MVRSLLTLLLLAACLVAQPQPSPAAAGLTTHVDVAPAKTSIYVGTVAMTMPRFDRRDGGFESTYIAKVFPYFFYNESGTIRIEFTEAMLAELQNGSPVEFQGRAERNGGGDRRIEGKATPDNATSGKLKVRVQYSKRVELIFNTTYQLRTAPKN